MKIIRLFCLIIILTFLLISCKKDTDFLQYQKTSFEYNAELTVKENGGVYTVCVKKDAENGNISLSFTEPEEMLSFSFIQKDGNIYALCGNTEYEGFSFPNVQNVFELFSLNTDDFISAESSKAGSTSVNIITFDNDVQLTLDARDNSVLAIESPDLKLLIKK